MSERKTQGSADAQLAGAPADEHMPTTRLPPIPAPPVQPSPRVASTSSGGPPPPSAPAAQPSQRASSSSPSEPPSLPMTSGSRVWHRWVDAVTALFHGSSGRSSLGSHEQSLVRRRVGFASASIGLILVVLGVALGLRGAPPNSSMEPVVVAGLVLARALTGLGILAFGTWLLRLSERLLLEKP